MFFFNSIFSLKIKSAFVKYKFSGLIKQIVQPIVSNEPLFRLRYVRGPNLKYLHTASEPLRSPGGVLVSLKFTLEKSGVIYLSIFVQCPTR